MTPFERLKKTTTKDNLWIYILFLLSEREIYAWEIPNLVKKKFGFLPGRITPYRVLYRLEKDGYVKSKLRERRRVYCITEKGKMELKNTQFFLEKILAWFPK